MNNSKLTPLYKIAKRILPSISSTNRASLLKRLMKEHRLSFSHCSMLNKLNEERFCLCLPMKLLTNNLLNSWNEVMLFGSNFPNHTLAGSFRLVENDLSDGRNEGGTYPMDKIIHMVCSPHGILHLFHGSFHLVHLSLQMRYPTSDGTF